VVARGVYLPGARHRQLSSGPEPILIMLNVEIIVAITKKKKLMGKNITLE
jgi:hypothetical protein